MKFKVGDRIIYTFDDGNKRNGIIHRTDIDENGRFIYYISWENNNYFCYF